MTRFSRPRLGRCGLGAVVALACGGALLAQTPAHSAAAKPASKSASSTASKAASVAPADPVVISAGSQQIRASQFSALMKAAPAANQAEMASHKRAIADELGKMLALVDAAHRGGLDRDPAFQAQMMLARDNALAKAEVDKLQAESTPTDAQAKAYYDAHSAEFAQSKVRHILITDSESQASGASSRTPAQALAKAQQIEAKLKQGGDFAAVAKADSDDPGSKDKGGELGEVVPGQTVPEFDAAIKDLPIGTISQPIHTRFGYHIVEVEARSTMPFEKAKPLIQEQLTGEAVSSAINKIAANSHLTISDSYFGPEQAKPAEPAQP